MRIGGFQKLTLVDFPGKVAATVFTQGCNFRCGYCHNPELVLPQLYEDLLPPEEVLNYLYILRKKIQGVVITGGEPTLQKGLIDFIIQIKNIGFAVKLDTNGSHPKVLFSLIELKLIDYIAMDIKTSLEKYSQAVGTFCDTRRIQESIDLIIKSGLPYQFRTTIIKNFCSIQDLLNIQKLITNSNHYILQPFVASPKLIDSQYRTQNQCTPQEMNLLKLKFELNAIKKPTNHPIS